MKIEIDHIPVDAIEGSTVMEAAASVGIVIPSMCYQPGYKNNSSCMVCMVRDDDTGMFFPSCAMPVAEGMKIITQSPDVREMRKQSLELLLSDHLGDCEAPCRLSCPAFMNIPLMNRLIANGDFSKALNVVRKEIAIPLILGYICPAPCEKACHRGSLDSPVSICLLKRITAQISSFHHSHESEEPEERPVKTGKKVAIIGSGPAGLSAAFYLLRSGHDCTIFDKNDQPGGAMRYMIPDHELPKVALDHETGLLSQMGGDFRMNSLVTKETFENEIIRDFDAVILATGNQKVQPLEIFLGDHPDPENFIDHKKLITSRPGVFVCGNIIREQKMAVRSSAQGRMAANEVDLYLETRSTGEKRIKFHSIIGRLHQEELNECLRESIPDARQEPACGFLSGFTRDEAIHEAKRCLHCDCRKPLSCKLRIYAEEYGAERRRFSGPDRKLLIKSLQHEFVVYEPEKCIKCGLCIEITKKEETALGLTFIGRGFDVRVSVPFNQSIKEALESTASECVRTCPTGALALKVQEERF